MKSLLKQVLGYGIVKLLALLTEFARHASSIVTTIFDVKKSKEQKKIDKSREKEIEDVTKHGTLTDLLNMKEWKDENSSHYYAIVFDVGLHHIADSRRPCRTLGGAFLYWSRSLESSQWYEIEEETVCLGAVWFNAVTCLEKQ